MEKFRYKEKWLGETLRAYQYSADMIGLVMENMAGSNSVNNEYRDPVEVREFARFLLECADRMEGKEND